MKRPTRKAPRAGANRAARQRTPPGDDVGAADLTRRLAARLHELRRARDWSLDDLSRASGVSRASLWQIESQRTNPSIGVLWKIAVGFAIPFAELLGDAAGQVLLLRRAESPVVRSPDGAMESRLVSPPGGAVGLELYELTLRARARHDAEGHLPGTREIVTVLSGSLRVHVGDEVHQAAAGDSIAFPADRPHAYENPGQAEARVHDLIVYGR